MIRPIRIEGDVAIVPLTRGMSARIDAVDVALVAGYNWYGEPRYDGIGWYAMRTRNKRLLQMHRVILGIEDKPEMLPDHRDGDGLNNTRANLRSATREQNALNRRSFRNSTGFKGVSLAVNTGKYVATITVGKKSKQLGSHDTAELAARAYDLAAIAAHGEFATTNEMLGRYD